MTIEDIAKQMVDSAKRAGVEVIKHQTHIVEDEMSPKAKKVIPGNSNKSIYEIMDESSLNYDEEYELMRYVEKKGIILRDMKIYNMKNKLRVSIGSSRENALFIKTLNKII